MWLPWRKQPGAFDTNPWDEDIGLSGWVPGVSKQLDVYAMMASLAHGQWTLAQWLESVTRVQVWNSRCLMFCAVMWVFIAVTQVGANLFHWWN